MNSYGDFKLGEMTRRNKLGLGETENENDFFHFSGFVCSFSRFTSLKMLQLYFRSIK